MADEAEARDVGQGVDSSLALGGDYFGSRLVQRCHGGDRRVDPGLPGCFLLDGSRDHPRAEGFGEQQSVAGLCAAVGENSLGINQAGDGVSELGFVVADAVSADNRATGFHHLGKSAGQDSLQNGEIAFFRKADQGQGGERTSAHGVDVAERIGGGNLPERVRVIHDGREEVGGLHQCGVRADLIHAGVVGVIEAD